MLSIHPYRIAVDELPKVEGTAGHFIRWLNNQEQSGVLSVTNGGSKFPSVSTENACDAVLNLSFGANAPHGNLSPVNACYMFRRVG